MLKAVDELPGEQVIYSNAPDLIYLHLRREALFLPAKRETTTRTDNGAYEQQMASMAGAMGGGEAVMVYFYFAEGTRPYLPVFGELIERMALAVAAEFEQGAILRGAAEAGARSGRL